HRGRLPSHAPTPPVVSLPSEVRPAAPIGTFRAYRRPQPAGSGVPTIRPGSGENSAMRRSLALLSGFTAAALTTSSCTGSSGPPAAASHQRPLPSATPLDAHTQLAGLAATAKDRRFQAGYTFSQAGRSPRTVLVVLAADGSWRVDGPTNVAVAG